MIYIYILLQYFDSTVVVNIEVGYKSNNDTHIIKCIHLSDDDHQGCNKLQHTT
jgi:hypothetical protein